MRLRWINGSLVSVVTVLVLSTAVSVVHADAPWVRAIDAKIDQADAAIAAGQLVQALAMAQAVIAETDAHPWGMVTDMDRASNLRKDALVQKLKIALYTNDLTQARNLVDQLKQEYPEQDIKEVRQASVQLGLISADEAAQEVQAHAAYKAIRSAWDNLNIERNHKATLQQLRPIFADEGAGLLAQMFAAEVLADDDKFGDAIAIWAKLWKQLPKNSNFRDKVQMRLWQAAGQNGREDLFREVCAEAINGRDVMFRMAARGEWVSRLRKMGRHQDVVSLVDDTMQHWDVYLDMVGQDDESDALEAIFGFEAGLALKALNRREEARLYFVWARAAVEDLPEVRADGRPIRIKRDLTANLKMEMREKGKPN